MVSAQPTVAPIRVAEAPRRQPVRGFFTFCAAAMGAVPDPAPAPPNPSQGSVFGPSPPPQDQRLGTHVVAFCGASS